MRMVRKLDSFTGGILSSLSWESFINMFLSSFLLLSCASTKVVDPSYPGAYRNRHGPYTENYTLRMQITSEPEGAAVYVNNLNRGKTPCIVDLPVSIFVERGITGTCGFDTNYAMFKNGIYDIKVVKQGYFEREITFTNDVGDNKIQGDKDGLQIPGTLHCNSSTGQAYIDNGIWIAKLQLITTEPYRISFGTHLQQKEYAKAELVRTEWIDFIRSIPEKKRTAIMRNELAKLEGVIGLTDSILISLREKLLEKLEQEDYDNALKIQQLIINREAQLQPPAQLQTIIKETGQGKNQIVTTAPQEVKIPDEIVVEQKPRYGVTDVMRNLNTLGVTTPLTKKDMAGFKLIDILLGR